MLRTNQPARAIRSLNRSMFRARETKSSGKFLACRDTFAAGLANQQKLASLWVLNSKAQQQVRLWITAASVGVSTVIAALGGQITEAPQVASEIPNSKYQNALNRHIAAAAGLWGQLPCWSQTRRAT